MGAAVIAGGAAAAAYSGPKLAPEHRYGGGLTLIIVLARAHEPT